MQSLVQATTCNLYDGGRTFAGRALLYGQDCYGPPGGFTLATAANRQLHGTYMSQCSAVFIANPRT